jgi:hypothetical protein
MKGSILITAILLLTTINGYSKKNAVTLDFSHYGVGFSEINTGTGQGMGYSINGSVCRGRKSLEVGLIYSDRESKFSGGDFKYKIYLGNIYRVEDQNKMYKPYLQYNLIYQKGTTAAPDQVTLGNTTYDIASEPGTVATIGHYLAFGNKIRLFGRTYIDSSLGFGYYIGALDKVNGPNTIGIHNGNNGITYAVKIGFGYTFN